MPKTINNTHTLTYIQQGFTLVELVTVILLIGILAVNVVPRFNGTDSYEAHTHRAQLIAALRLTQQRAMQQTDTTDDLCHDIVFDADENRYGIPNRTSCIVTNPVFPDNWQADSTGHTVAENYQISFDIEVGGSRLTNPQTIGFNWLGQPTKSCLSGCKININSAVESLQITIEPEGYIHVFDLP